MSCEEIPEEYLLIPLSDMHFGLNSKYDYAALQREIADRILNRYEEILITLHGDYFHVDNLLNTTEKGTRIDEVDFDASIEDGFNFIMPLLDLALENSRKVTLVYLKGNHAPSTDFVFVKALQKLYTQIKFDLKFNEYKHARLGPHSIFLHHGDKIKNPEKLHQVITAKFSKEWGESQSRYLITGHYPLQGLHGINYKAQVSHLAMIVLMDMILANPDKCCLSSQKVNAVPSTLYRRKENKHGEKTI